MQDNNSDDLLQFKDFSNSPSTSSPPPAQISVNSPTHSTNSGRSGGRVRGDPLSDLIYDMSTSANILGGTSNMGGGASLGKNDEDGTETAGTSKLSFLTIEYYQKFFNVDTYMVLERITNSIIPKRAGEKYLRSNIGQNPDLYGPFWISVTLIFSIAISGNIASYLQHASDDYHWKYNFHLVSYAATCIFVYVNILPCALWAIFKYSLKPVEEGLETENANYTPSLLSLMCIYGYSLSIYIPVSILWVIQISLLQWILVISAAMASGLVLVMVLSPALKNSNLSFFLMISIISAHFLLAAGFMLYFFHVPSHQTESDKSAPVKAVTEAVANIVKHAAASVSDDGTGNATG